MRLTAGAAGHEPARPLEQAVARAQVAEHEHGREERHHRQQPQALLPGPAEVDPPGREHHQRGRHGGDGLGQAPGPDDGEDQHRCEQQCGERLLSATGPRRSGASG